VLSRTSERGMRCRDPCRISYNLGLSSDQRAIRAVISGTSPGYARLIETMLLPSSNPSSGALSTVNLASFIPEVLPRRSPPVRLRSREWLCRSPVTTFLWWASQLGECRLAAIPPDIDLQLQLANWRRC